MTKASEQLINAADVEEKRKPEGYWIVDFTVYAFDTEAEAKQYQNALIDAFCDMPESVELGSSSKVRWQEYEEEFETPEW